MRTFKVISITVLTIFIILVIALNVVMIKQQNHTDGQYRVEVKRLADEIEETGSYNPANYSFIKGVYAEIKDGCFSVTLVVKQA